MNSHARQSLVSSSHHVGDIIDQLRNSSYSVLDGLTSEAYTETCRSLGEVVAWDDVKVVDGNSSVVYGSRAVPAHTDPATVNIVAWLCVRQDDDDGTSILFDTTPLLRSFSSETRSQLASINVYNQIRKPGSPRGCVPLLRGHDDASWQVYYAPWLLPDSLSAEQRHALTVFQNAISCSEPTRIRMRSGQALFVNNYRVLHARNAVKPDSARLLKRAWVQTPTHRQIIGC
jgi:hypothetical protein